MTFREIFGFLPAREQAFREFIFRQEMYTLRLYAGLLALVHLSFVVIDFYRVQQYGPVLIMRLLMVVVLVSMIYFAQVRWHIRQQLLVLCNLLSLVFTFSMDALADMPAFFLPNSLVLFYFSTSTITGIRFSYAVGLNVLTYALYLFYLSAPYALPFHRTQIPNMTLNLLVSTLVGYLWEWNKRVNFMQHERLVEHTREIERVNAQKNKLISILSHDLAAPMNSLKGLLHIDDQEALSREEWRIFSASLKRNIAGNLLLLQNLVRWSKSQMDGFNLQPAIIDLQSLVNDTLQELISLQEEKQIVVQQDLKPLTYAYADGEMVKLIVRNILSNAFKFSSPGGKVYVSASREDQQLALRIRDEGSGMSEAQIQHLFSFEAVASPGTFQEKGAGLGLILSREFALLNRGNILVSSRLGIGTQFTLLLPIRP